jgi:cell division protein FtsL
MPRGVKRTTDQMIAALDEKIQKKQGEISALKAQRKELTSASQADLATKLLQMAEEKGLTLEQLLQSLK